MRDGQTQSRYDRAARGFTIMELLVVLGILSLLLGMLVPALSSVRTGGRATLCRNNLRHMAVAAHAYSNIYHHYPPALSFRQIDGVWARVEWDWITTFTGELVGPGPLWQFTDNPGEVMQCPEFFGNANSPGNPYTGYNYSPYLGGEQQMSGSMKFHRGAAPHQVRRPSACAMFGLGEYSAGANKFMRAPLHNQLSTLTLPPGVIYAGGQAYSRYNGETFIAYADGHIGSHNRPEEGVNATPARLEIMGYPRNGFLSHDNAAYQPR
jgi:prepilin-type N-terminal cleavage/methylation domain-containing protein